MTGSVMGRSGCLLFFFFFPLVVYLHLLYQAWVGPANWKPCLYISEGYLASDSCHVLYHDEGTRRINGSHPQKRNTAVATAVAATAHQFIGAVEPGPMFTFRLWFEVFTCDWDYFKTNHCHLPHSQTKTNRQARQHGHFPSLLTRVV